MLNNRYHLEKKVKKSHNKKPNSPYTHEWLWCFKKEFSTIPIVGNLNEWIEARHYYRDKSDNRKITYKKSQSVPWFFGQYIMGYEGGIALNLNYLKDNLCKVPHEDTIRQINILFQ